MDPSLFVSHLIDQHDEAQTRLDRFNGLPKDAAYNWYKYHGNWSNRIIRGNAASVMASLLAKENMAGQVQMVYFDPPYGISYDSNYQSSSRKRKGGIPSEAASVKAFRDAYRHGIHSYLDEIRHITAHIRDLLADSGSLFLQIGAANAHRLALVLDEVFGSENRVATIPFAKTSGSSTKLLPEVNDYILWYAKDKECVKYRRLYDILSRKEIIEYMSFHVGVELADGTSRPLTKAEREDPDEHLPVGARLYRRVDITSQQESTTGRSEPFVWDGVEYTCPPNRHWSISHEGLQRLVELGRLVVTGNNKLHWKKYENEVPGRRINNMWHRQMSPSDIHYVVETAESTIERCMLMSTDPGDLVLDPTCGSGTTATISEKWGRRWITIDASAIPAALCRQRILSAVNDWYAIRSQTADARGSNEDPSAGFVYAAVPDVSAATLAYDKPPNSIPLVNRPKIKKGLKRISSPFTVESHSPNRYVTVDAPNDTEQRLALQENVLNAVQTAGILDISGHRSYIDDLESWPEGKNLTHVARLRETGERVAITILSDDQTASVRKIDLAAEEAGLRQDINKLIIIAFEFEADAYDGSSERRGRLEILKVRANRDLTILNLKHAGTDNAFVLVGEPDIEVRPKGADHMVAEVKGYDTYDPATGIVRSGSSKEVDCWMIDTDYNGQAFFARRIHLPARGGDRQISKLKKKLGRSINPEHWAAMGGLVSAPFKRPSGGRIAVRIITATGAEMTTVKEISDTVGPKT